MLWNDYTEPTRIRAAALAVVQLLATLGLTLPFDLPGLVESLIALSAFILPIVTGELIRRKVRPVGRHEAPEESSSPLA